MNKLANFLQKKYSVLGLNRRNQEYIRPFNSASSIRIANSKLLTKRVLGRHEIATSTLYKVIRNHKQLKTFDWASLPKSFVIKPNRGTQGAGILIFYGKKKGKEAWIRSNGSIMTKDAIQNFIEKILEGNFSLGNRPDIALIEERVINHPTLKEFSYKGVPDIRIIVFNNVPIMAMTRIPTKESDGKANLHAGAICAGIDMANGTTTSAIHLKRNAVLSDSYEKIYQTMDLKENKPVTGIKIPYWNQILEIAIKCQKITGLGYIGVDIGIDKNKGPVVFEVNARPGLGIQVANNSGLRTRLEKVKDINVRDIQHGIRLAKTLFGGEIEDEIETLTGKNIVGIKEKVIVYHQGFSPKDVKKGKRKYEVVKALLDTGILTSRINVAYANRIGWTKTLTNFYKLDIPQTFKTLKNAKLFIQKHEEDILTKFPSIIKLLAINSNGNIQISPVIEITIKIADEIKTILCAITTEKNITYPISIGRKDMKNYLIDIQKK